MLDTVGCAGSEDSSADGTGSLPSKRQYTLKGVEAEAIDLMRSAASRDGMKIGAWVSMRMKEAAERSLLNDPVSDSAPTLRERARHSRRTAVQHISNDSGAEALIPGLVSRVIELETELREIAKTQRAILTRLITQS